MHWNVFIFLALFLLLILEKLIRRLCWSVYFAFMLLRSRSNIPPNHDRPFCSHTVLPQSLSIFLFYLLLNSMIYCRLTLSEHTAVNSFSFTKHLWISFDVSFFFFFFWFLCAFWALWNKNKLFLWNSSKIFYTKPSIQTRVIDTLLNCLFWKTNIPHFKLISHWFTSTWYLQEKMSDFSSHSFSHWSKSNRKKIWNWFNHSEKKI